MICHKIGIPPISIIGFGLKTDSSEMRDPKPPANNTTFMLKRCFIMTFVATWQNENSFSFALAAPKVLKFVNS